jgi:N-acyl-D-amino-acid deacylase
MMQGFMNRATLVALALITGCRPGATNLRAPGTIISNVAIYDGTGALPRTGSVRIVGDRIVQVGPEVTASTNDVSIDGSGLALAPGFIDTHSHADRALRRGSDGLGALSQGITTVVVGQDGGSPYPLGEFFATLANGVPVNVASYVGHGTIRARVMGEDYKRAATAQEIARMRTLLQQELAAGALGLSTGLEYDPGIYSTRAEVLELARATASAGGRYISHIRSEDRAFWDAIDEIIEIGRATRMPVQISHIKLAMKPLLGHADSLMRILDRARADGVDITADVYPYRYWQSGLSVLFPERNFNDRAAAEFALDQISRPQDITLTNYGPNPSYNGKTLAEIATQRGEAPAVTIMALLNEVEAARNAGRPAGQTIIAASMIEPDIERLIAWPHANICTDGELDGRHPRGFGSFPRVLGHYVRTRGVVSLPEAIRKMTSLAAHHMGMSERGVIAPGAYADLVLFDPQSVIDRATPDQPHAVASGISKVWVNGVLAYDGGRVTGQRAGRRIYRGSADGRGEDRR